MTTTYDIGDTITYRTWGVGPGSVRTGVVVAKEDDIKNGRPGFSLDTSVWGYDDQIISVERA